MIVTLNFKITDQEPDAVPSNGDVATLADQTVAAAPGLENCDGADIAVPLLAAPSDPAQSPTKLPSVIVDEEQFTSELEKIDLELEQSLAEEGLEEYLRLCPPY